MTRIITVLFCSFLAITAHAATVRDLYQAEAVVQSQAEEDRLAVLPDLLDQVLRKVVGDRQQLTPETLSLLHSQAASLVETFHYDFEAVSDALDPPRLLLKVGFAESALNAAIRAAGLPIWGAVRPQVLVWELQETDSLQWANLSVEGASIQQAINSAAQRRGIPLFRPLMDLSDSMLLSADQLVAGDLAAVLAASQRYDANVILTSWVRGPQENSEIEWYAILNQQGQTWRTAGDRQHALAEGVEIFADLLGRQLAQVANATAFAVQLTVSDIRSYADMQRLLQYLESLPQVASVTLERFADGELQMEIGTQGDVSSLQQTFAFGQVLRSSQVAGGGVLHYRLLP